MSDYRHYIRTDGSGIIVHGFSSAFEQPLETDIMIAENDIRHFHEVFLIPLMNIRGQYILKWNGEIIERTQAELDEEWSARIIAPSIDHRANAVEGLLLEILLGG